MRGYGGARIACARVGKLLHGRGRGAQVGPLVSGNVVIFVVHSSKNGGGACPVSAPGARGSSGARQGVFRGAPGALFKVFRKQKSTKSRSEAFEICEASHFLIT